MHDTYFGLKKNLYGKYVQMFEPYTTCTGISVNN